MQELFTDAQRLIHDSLVQHPQSPINPTSFYHEVACSGPNELIALALHPELALYLAWTELSQVLDGLQTWMSVDLSHLRFLRFEVRIAGQEGAVVPIMDSRTLPISRLGDPTSIMDSKTRPTFQLQSLTRHPYHVLLHLPPTGPSPRRSLLQAFRGCREVYLHKS